MLAIAIVVSALAFGPPKPAVVADVEAAVADGELRPGRRRRVVRAALKELALSDFYSREAGPTDPHFLLALAESTLQLTEGLDLPEARASAQAEVARARARLGREEGVPELLDAVFAVWERESPRRWPYDRSLERAVLAAREVEDAPREIRALRLQLRHAKDWQLESVSLRLATLHFQDGDARSARLVLEAGADRLMRTLDGDRASDLLLKLGSMEEELGRPEQAAEAFRRALALQVRYPQRIKYDKALHGYIRCLVALSRLEEAGSFLDAQEQERSDVWSRARRLAEANDRSAALVEPVLAAQVASVRGAQAYVAARSGRYTEAAEIWMSAAEVFEKTSRYSVDGLQRIRLNQGALLLDMGEVAEADALLTALLDELEGQEGDAIRAPALANLANARGLQGRFDDEAELRALAIAAYGGLDDDLAVARQLGNAAALDLQKGLVDAARQGFAEAIAIRERMLGPDHPDTAAMEARAVHADLAAGDLEGARERLERAWPVGWLSTRSDVQRRVAAAASELWAREGRIDAAILARKWEVERLQAMREQVRSRALFGEANAAPYRALADLLVERGRLAEAEQVLRLLKQEEYAAYVRGTATGAASYTEAEVPWKERFEAVRDDVVALGARRAELRRKQEMTDADREALAALEGDLRAAKRGMAADLRDLAQAFADESTARAVDFGRADTASLGAQQAAIGRLGDDVVLLHYFSTRDRLWILVTTPHAQVKREVAVAETELNRAVAVIRQVLQDPTSDPRPAAQALHELLVAPIASDLEQAGAKTLMVYLDGALRYVPLAALHDGQQWLLERYALATYTPAARATLETRPAETLSIAAVGVSQGGTVEERHFAPLPAVPGELDAIVRQKPNDRGVADGVVYLDKGFTAERFRDVLADRWAVVHVASHFVLTPGSDERSFLLLGDGAHLSLADMKYGDFQFADTELLTLSACETALDDGSDGSALEGFGTLAQNRGARAVLATLWSVADASTATLMTRFYEERAGGETKAEALRRAQLSLLEIDAEAGAQRGFSMVALPDAEPGFRHPYYWAPFVLMGNWL